MAHTVQLYGSDVPALARGVVSFAQQGLDRGASLLFVATPEHRGAMEEEFARRGIGADAGTGGPTIAWFDAASLLSRLLADGYPDAGRFERHVGRLVAELSDGGRRPLRVFGEMVGLLWEAGQFPSAIRLEQLWNRLLTQRPFELYCAYPIDIWSAHFEGWVLEAMMCAHTALVPMENGERLQQALDAALREVVPDFCGSAGMRRGARSSWPAFPNAEATVLWLREQMPAVAPRIIARAQEVYRAV
jgi:hypothetical protein